MKKYFNDTGLSIPEKHFMVDISAKMKQIMRLVEGAEHFIVNCPRQFGKTTTVNLLYYIRNYSNSRIILLFALVSNR